MKKKINQSEFLSELYAFIAGTLKQKSNQFKLAIFTDTSIERKLSSLCQKILRKKEPDPLKKFIDFLNGLSNILASKKALVIFNESLTEFNKKTDSDSTSFKQTDLVINIIAYRILHWRELVYRRSCCQKIQPN